MAHDPTIQIIHNVEYTLEFDFSLIWSLINGFPFIHQNWASRRPFVVNWQTIWEHAPNFVEVLMNNIDFEMNRKYGVELVKFAELLHHHLWCYSYTQEFMYQYILLEYVCENYSPSHIVLPLNTRMVPCMSICHKWYDIS